MSCSPNAHKCQSKRNLKWHQRLSPQSHLSVLKNSEGKGDHESQAASADKCG